MRPEPAHLEIARRYIGLREIPGPKSTPLIVSFWSQKDAWLGTDDSKVAWCGAFLRFIFGDHLHLPVPRAYYRAREWLKFGTPIDYPVRGAIVVFERGGAGHVAIVDHQDAEGNLGCIGGNQGDGVSIAYFPLTGPKARKVLGYRIPPGMEIPAMATLPVLARAGQISTNEA